MEYLEPFLRAEVDRAIRTNLQYCPELMLAVFPLAPIPLIAKLGELLGDKREVDVFQKTRNPETWCWQAEQATNTFTTERIQRDEGDVGKIAIVTMKSDEMMWSCWKQKD